MTKLEKILGQIDTQYIELNDGRRFAISGVERYFYKEQLSVYTMRAFGDDCFYDYTKYFASLEKEAESIDSSKKLRERMLKLADEYHIVAIKLTGLPISYINKKLEETDCNIRKFNAIDKNLSIIDELCTKE